MTRLIYYLCGDGDDESDPDDDACLDLWGDLDLLGDRDLWGDLDLWPCFLSVFSGEESASEPL